MSTKEAKRRSVQLEFEVPGTPEQVWQAIATGPGISSWLFPTDVEEREGGAVAFHIAPGWESSGNVTGWEPPRRFAYEEPDWAPNAPPLATEFIIEPRTGDVCIVRLVHSLFASGDEWDDQLEGFETGWRSFFNILRLYLLHFSGQRVASFRVMGTAPVPESNAWEALTGALGLARASEGQRWSAPASGPPPLAGIIERAGDSLHVHELKLLLDKPAPGIALFGVYTLGGKVHAAISFFLFGDQAPAVVARDEPLWRAWMLEQYPSDQYREQ